MCRLVEQRVPTNPVRMSARVSWRVVLLSAILALACSPAHQEGEIPAAAAAEGAAARAGQEESVPSDTAATKAVSSSPDVAAERPRIILLVSLDTLRADHMGLYGHYRFTTPVIDIFALKGVVFEDASSTAPWTLPSHASMLTGLYPLRHGVTTTSSGLHDDVPTLASMLLANGYTTAAVINAPWLEQTTFGVTRGFEKFVSVQNPDYGRRSPSSWVTEQAIEWLREDDGGPLFLFVHYFDIHADYKSEPRYERLFVTPYDGPADGTGWQIQIGNFADEHIELCRREYSDELCMFGSKQKPRRLDGSITKIEFDPPAIRHLSELYDAGIRQLDSELGRLLRAISIQGIDDETLVIITSDHGEEFMDHGRVDHFLTQYQEMLHVPLILRGPGIPEGVRVSAPVSLVDLAPTILAMAGAKQPHALDGQSLLPLMRGESSRAFEDRYLYGEASGGLSHASSMPGIYPIYRSVRQGRFKLIHDSKTEQYRLYDLVEDAREVRDVTDQYPQVAARLRGELEARYGVPGSAASPGKKVELDEEELEQLRALGYVP